ncbi:MAG: hypothetical protein V1838_02270 [Patescibacteria group bacterium]
MSEVFIQPAGKLEFEAIYFLDPPADVISRIGFKFHSTIVVKPLGKFSFPELSTTAGDLEETDSSVNIQHWSHNVTPKGREKLKPMHELVVKKAIEEFQQLKEILTGGWSVNKIVFNAEDRPLKGMLPYYGDETILLQQGLPRA